MKDRGRGNPEGSGVRVSEGRGRGIKFQTLDVQGYSRVLAKNAIIFQNTLHNGFHAIQASPLHKIVCNTHIHHHTLLVYGRYGVILIKTLQPLLTPRYP